MRIAMRRIFPSENKYGNGMNVNDEALQKKILLASLKVVEPQDPGERYQMSKGDTLIEDREGNRYAVAFLD